MREERRDDMQRRGPLRQPRGRPPRRSGGSAASLGASQLSGSTTTATRSSTRRTSPRLSTCTRRPSATCRPPHERPVFFDYGHYIHVTTYAPREDEEGELHAVECVVGEYWVVTAHDEPIPVLEDFADRVSGSGNTGTLDGPSFLAALLEWVLGSYSAAFERMEQRLEEFDVQAMRGDGSDEDIEVLVSMRRQVGKLRRALASHRSALVALTHPELVLLGNDESGERFESLYSRYEATVQEARDAREAIVGSFDVLIARGGHHTNQIMKVLTLTSVILLPGRPAGRGHGHELRGRDLRPRRTFLGRAGRDHRGSPDHLRRRQAEKVDLTRPAVGATKGCAFA